MNAQHCLIMHNTSIYCRGGKTMNRLNSTELWINALAVRNYRIRLTNVIWPHTHSRRTTDMINKYTSTRSLCKSKYDYVIRVGASKQHSRAPRKSNNCAYQDRNYERPILDLLNSTLICHFSLSSSSPQCLCCNVEDKFHFFEVRGLLDSAKIPQSWQITVLYSLLKISWSVGITVVEISQQAQLGLLVLFAVPLFMER